MKASELKGILEYELNNHKGDFEILITLSDPSIGSRASTTISYAGFGFDWETGQFRLEPSEKVCREKYKQDVPRLKLMQRFDGRSYYFCPKCGGGTKVARDDNYCRHCGQRLSYEYEDVT